MSSERVLAIPEAVFETVGLVNGVRFGHGLADYLNVVLHPANLLYLDRDFAEEAPQYKQLISYCVLKDGDNIFRYQRTKKGGESRLHGKWSIGVGGHINPVDVQNTNFQDTYLAALKRELGEEVGIEGEFRNNILGCIYDDSTPVGRVHFGIVHLLELEPGFHLHIRDEALDNGQFIPLAYLKNHIEDFENWSRLVLKNLL